VQPGGRDIVVGPPVTGPTGGTVVGLAAARKRSKSGCPYGPGPRYAVLGTSRNDRINGTSKGHRILGLGGNNRIAVQAGSSSVWAGNRSDGVFPGNGSDKVWAGPATTGSP
jgi:hypothetical protein